MKILVSVSAIVSLIAGLMTIIHFLGNSPALDANLPLLTIAVGPWAFLMLSGILSSYGLIGISYLAVRYYRTRRIGLTLRERESRVSWVMTLVSLPFLLFWIKAALGMLLLSISTEAASSPILQPFLWLVALSLTALVLMFCYAGIFYGVGDELYEVLE